MNAQTTTPSRYTAARRDAILKACQMADSFKGLSQNRGTEAGTIAFQESLDALVTLAFSGDHRGMALASTFASRVEASGRETATLVAALMGENVPETFLARMDAQGGEAARGFMVVAGLPTSAICPNDFPTLSRFWLHLVSLRMG